MDFLPVRAQSARTGGALKTHAQPIKSDHPTEPGQRLHDLAPRHQAGGKAIEQQEDARSLTELLVVQFIAVSAHELLNLPLIRRLQVPVFSRCLPGARSSPAISWSSAGRMGRCIRW